MIEIKKDLFDNINNLDCLVCTTNQIVKANGELVMGAGIAKEFRDRYSGTGILTQSNPIFKNSLSKIWGERTKFKESGILVTQIFTLLKDNSLYIKYLCGLPTKHDWKDKSDINLIINSCKELLIVANAMDWKNIGMTKPGCGNGGLLWEDVKKAIGFLDERFIIHVQ